MSNFVPGMFPQVALRVDMDTWAETERWVRQKCGQPIVGSKGKPTITSRVCSGSIQSFNMSDI